MVSLLVRLLPWDARGTAVTVAVVKGGGWWIIPFIIRGRSEEEDA